MNFFTSGIWYTTLQSRDVEMMNFGGYHLLLFRKVVIIVFRDYGHKENSPAIEGEGEAELEPMMREK